MPWKPESDDDFPTLGWQVIDWMTTYLAAPDREEYEPFIPYAEQEDFLLNYYRLDPATGKRKIHRGVISRPRGWGKSPFAAAIAAAEALGPVCFGGWDAHGQPVGQPWSRKRTPYINLAGVSEAQTANTYDALLEMLEGPNLYEDYPGLEPMGSFVHLPRGRIRTITANASTNKGTRCVFAVLDQSEVWYQSNGGKNLATVMRSNAAKTGGSTLETPNAFIPGMGSVAEESAAYWENIKTGRTLDDGLYYDHREAPADTEMGEKSSLMRGLRYTYGDASGHPDGCVIHDPPCPPGHIDLDRIAATVWDTNTDPQVARSDFLNQITHASDSWLSQPEVRAIVDDSKEVMPGDQIVLGFDGSRGRTRGKADATALVAMRISDKHLFTIRIWEQGPNDPQDWQPNLLDVEATLADVFDRYQVVAFYADPSGWQGQVADWEAKYGRKLRVRGSRNAPISIWPRGRDSRVCEAVENMRQAIVGGEMTMSNDPQLIRHFLNARRRATRTGYLLYKAHPSSPDKIDAAYAAVMAYKACLDAISGGYVGGPRKRRKAVIL